MPKNDPLEELNIRASEREAAQAKEIASYKQTIAKMVSERDALAAVQGQGATPNRHYCPDEAMMRSVWNMAYTEAIRSIFSKGLSYWTSKTQVLKAEMQLAAIRADECVEALIAVRKTFMDPTTKEMEAFNKDKSTNPLLK